jgi:hypothetical protein
MMRALRSIAVPVGRLLWPPVAWLRWAVGSALILAIVGAVAATSIQVHVNRDCKGGAFSSGFSSAFDIRRCGSSLNTSQLARRSPFRCAPIGYSKMTRHIAANIGKDQSV